MGKGLAEFRRASDDFKRTWEREVAMEAAKLETEIENTVNYEELSQAYIQENVTPVNESIMPEPMVKAPEPEMVVARGSASVSQSPEPLSQTAEPLTPAAEPAAPEPFRKQDWL